MIRETAGSLKVGYGLEPGVQMGPVITAESRQRIEGLIAKGVAAGAEAAVDGRGVHVSGFEKGSFVGPTVLDGVPAGSGLAETEIFGPVLSVIHARDIDEAVDVITRNATAMHRRSSRPAARRRASSATRFPPATWA